MTSYTEMQPFSNPARIAVKKAEEIYPYYAGFSKIFAEDAIAWATQRNRNSLVLDPWNGSGTTTRTASQLGIASIGFDLNPVVVLVAKAEQLDPCEAPVLLPLARRIVKAVRKTSVLDEQRPLDAFFHVTTSRDIVELARSIWLHVVGTSLPTTPGQAALPFEEMAPLAGCYFVALFNSVRKFLHSLSTSNPTWLRMPKNDEQKVHLPRKFILDAFISEVTRVHEIVSTRRAPEMPQSTRLALADSRSLPLPSESVDAVVTSPPYCTRLDYGRSTMPELLILESIGAASYMDSRRQLMGASTVKKTGREVFLGPKCEDFLEQIRMHPSKASGTYYFQSHLSYFNDLSASISEIGRVLAPNGRMCMVVQDSYYKELHNDLPAIVGEMAANCGFGVVGAFEYRKLKSMCGINKASQVYRSRRVPIEVAVLLAKG